METLSSGQDSVLNSAGRYRRCGRIQGMNKGWDTAVFASRNKVAMEMKNRTIWVCVRGRNGGGIKDEFGFGFFVVLFASNNWENSSNFC